MRAQQRQEVHDLVLSVPVREIDDVHLDAVQEPLDRPDSVRIRAVAAPRVQTLLVEPAEVSALGPGGAVEAAGDRDPRALEISLWRGRFDSADLPAGV